MPLKHCVIDKSAKLSISEMLFQDDKFAKVTLHTIQL